MGRCYALFPLVVCRVALLLIQSGLFNWGWPLPIYSSPHLRLYLVLSSSVWCILSLILKVIDTIDKYGYAFFSTIIFLIHLLGNLEKHLYFSIWRKYFIPNASTASVSRYLYSTLATPYRFPSPISFPSGLKPHSDFNQCHLEIRDRTVFCHCSVLTGIKRDQRSRPSDKRARQGLEPLPYGITTSHQYLKPIQYHIGFPYRVHQTRAHLSIVL